MQLNSGVYMLVGSTLIIAMKWRGREIPRRLRDKDYACQCRRHRRCQSIPELGRSCSRKWQATPVFLPGKAHAQRILVVYTPWAHKESDTTEHRKEGWYLLTSQAWSSCVLWWKGDEVSLAQPKVLRIRERGYF